MRRLRWIAHEKSSSSSSSSSSSFSQFFNVLNVNYSLRGASRRLMLPSFNLEYMHKSWSYLTTKLWNGLPTRVRECPLLGALCFRLWHGFNFAWLLRILGGWARHIGMLSHSIHMDYFNSSNFNFNAHSIANWLLYIIRSYILIRYHIA